MDFTLDELNAITSGVDESWSRIGDPSKYGGVYKNPKYPGKVVKIQDGDYGIYDNEVSKQFQAYSDIVPEHYEVSKLGQTGFFPTEGAEPEVKVPNSDINTFSFTNQGKSFIEMDEADFAQTSRDPTNQPSRWEKHARAKGLIELYRKANINHRDTHGGNIKYNPDTNKAVILDFGLASNTGGAWGDGNAMRVRQIQDGLTASGNNDFRELFDEQWGSIENDLEGIRQDSNLSDGARQTKLKSSLDNRQQLLREAEDVVMKTGPDVEPVVMNPDETGSKISDSPKPTVERRGPITMDDDMRRMMEQVNKNLEAINARTYGTGLGTKVNRLAGQALDIGPLKAGGAFGAADFIPSVETIRTGERDGLAAAGKKHLTDMGHGLVYGSGIGLTTAAIPVLTLPATAVGGAMLLDQGLQSINEATRVATGDTALSKVRQAAGITPRTGNVESSAAEKFTREMARNNNPDLVQIKPQTRTLRTQVKDTPIPDFAHRLRLAGQRFNPKRGEFGITELLFGR